MVEPHGAFVEVYVATSLEVCEGRDRKGLYARARQGLIPQFTGISDPYEPPTHAEIVIDTAQVSASDAVQHILGYLTQSGYLIPQPLAPAPEKDLLESERPELDVSDVRSGEAPTIR
jgi:adenylylsulfate kinase-like enzyme